MASQKHTRSNDNYYRFNRLLVDIGTKVLRRLLEFTAGQQATNVDALLQISRIRLKLKKLCPGTLHQSQLDRLYPPGGGAVDLHKWDITLLSCVLINIGKLSKPDEDKVKEIREIRNTFSGHITETSMDNVTYTTQWRNLTGILNDLAALCNDADFAKEIKDFIDFVKSERESDVYQQRMMTWADDESIFIQTRACKRIKELVENKNIVTIGGHSGGGKSAIAHHVALSYASQGYAILPVSRAEEIKQLSNAAEKQLFVVDDPVGKNQLDQQELQLYERYHDDLEALLKSGVKLIFTCRTYICKDTRFKSQTTVIGKHIVDIFDDVFRLTVDERRAILKKHLRVSVLSHAEEYIANEQYPNYPFLCKMFASEPYHNRGIQLFAKPFAVFQEELDRIHEAKYCALVLCIIFTDGVEEDMFNPFHVRYNETKHKVKQIMNACGIDKAFTRANLLNEIESLVGTFLIKEGDHFRFMHDILYDVTALHFGNRYPCVVLEHASSNFIREFIRVDVNEANVNNVVQIKEIHFPALAKRIVTDISNGYFFDVFLNPIFMNKNFQTAMQQRVRNMTESEVYHMTIDSKPIIKVQQFSSNTGNHSSLRKQARILTELSFLAAGMVGAMHWLLAFGHIDLFHVIFQKLSIPDEEWRRLPSTANLLSFACSSGELDIVRIIFDKGNYSNESLKHDNTNVMGMAVLSGNPTVVRYILERSPNISLSSYDGKTPLHMVGMSGTLHGENVKQMVSILLDLGIGINTSDAYGLTPLYMAAGTGHIDAVHVLLDRGSNVNQCNKNDVSPTSIASEYGHVDVVRVLLDKGGNVNQCNNDGFFPMYIACHQGHVDVVRVLLDKGGDVNQCNNDGFFPLWIASEYGHVDVVRVLLDNGGNVNQCNNDGFFPLWIASHQGHVDVVRALLDNGGDVNQRNKDGFSSLWVASQEGHVDIVRVLLDKGGDVNKLDNGGDINQSNNEGISPLWIASQEGHVDIVDVLLENGGNVNQCNKVGRSPLGIATEVGHADIVRVLLDKGGNVNQCDNDGFFPLWIASHKGHVDVVYVLLGKGADVNQCYKDGVSSLYIASENGHVDIIRMLLNKGVNVNQCNEYGVSPLWVASHQGHVDVVCALLDKGGNVNQCRDDGRSPLFIASQNGHINVVRVLLDKGGNVNKCNEKGASPLWTASYSGKADVARMLLDMGGDVNQCNKDDISPLYIASEEGHVDIVRMLLNEGGTVDHCEKEGAHALWIASQNGHADVTRLLLDNGGNVNQSNNVGASPLWIASQEGHVDVVRVLLSNGGNVNQCKCDDKSTPLSIACYSGHVDVVRVLIEYGADITTYDMYRLYPLWIAVNNGHLDVVRTLLGQGANANVSNRYGLSALAVASKMGHADIVLELIQHGADVNMPTTVTPLDAANFYKHYNIVVMLIKHGAKVHNCKAFI